MQSVKSKQSVKSVKSVKSRLNEWITEFVLIDLNFSHCVHVHQSVTTSGTRDANAIKNYFLLVNFK